MQIPNQNARLNGFLTLATFVVVVVIMKEAQEVLIPIALTILLTFLLTPLVVLLSRWGTPKTLAIIITVSLAFGVIGGVGYLVFTEAASVAQDLPNYENNIRAKITSLRPAHSRTSLSRLNEMVQHLRTDLDKNVKEAAAPSPLGTGGPKPVPVDVVPREPSAVDIVHNLLGPILQPIGTAVIVAVFVITMLFQREDLRDRFIKVISAGRLNLATQALDDAAHRVARYLLMQLMVNTCYGVPIGVMLYLIGIPHAILWGILSTLLRFIPFLGPWIAACFPVALAAAIDPGWAKLLYTFGIYFGMEIITPNLIEPWLYGSSTGISNLALLIAAVFWTWLWGTPGLFLSTPLTVCIMVLGKHVAGLQFLSVLLGSEPVLEPSARFYQRMLSMDASEMLVLATEYIKDRSLEEFYNEVFLPALFMSEQDRHSGALAEVRQKFIFEASRELIEELERRSEAAAAAAVPPSGDGTSLKGARKQEDETRSPAVVYGMPARDDADEVVALMVQHLLRNRGIETEIIPVTVHAEEYASWIKRNQIKVAFISALPPSALVGARQLCHRLRETCPETKILVGIWDRQANFDELNLRLRRPKPDVIVTNLGEAVRQIEKLLSGSDPAVGIDDKSDHIELPTPGENSLESKIEPLGLIDSDTEELMGMLTRDLAQHFGVPISLVTISANDQPYWRSRLHLPPEVPVGPKEGAPAPGHLFPDEIQIIEDITKDRRFANTATLTERGIRFFAGAPLRNRDGRVVGSISVVDTKPRPPNDLDRQILSARADEFMDVVEELDLIPDKPAPAAADPSNRPS